MSDIKCSQRAYVHSLRFSNVFFFTLPLVGMPVFQASYGNISPSFWRGVAGSDGLSWVTGSDGWSGVTGTGSLGWVTGKGTFSRMTGVAETDGLSGVTGTDGFQDHIVAFITSSTGVDGFVTGVTGTEVTRVESSIHA